MSRRLRISVNRDTVRTLQALIDPVPFDAFEKMAAAHGLNNGPFLRLIVEALAKDPGKLDDLLNENGLKSRVIELEQQILAAAQWCPDGCCEFRRLKFKAPPIEQFRDNFLKLVEGQ